MLNRISFNKFCPQPRCRIHSGSHLQLNIPQTPHINLNLEGGYHPPFQIFQTWINCFGTWNVCWPAKFSAYVIQVRDTTRSSSTSDPTVQQLSVYKVHLGLRTIHHYGYICFLCWSHVELYGMVLGLMWEGGSVVVVNPESSSKLFIFYIVSFPFMGCCGSMHPCIWTLYCLKWYIQMFC
jgi:hypothetical protein